MAREVGCGMDMKRFHVELSTKRDHHFKVYCRIRTTLPEEGIWMREIAWGHRPRFGKELERCHTAFECLEMLVMRAAETQESGVDELTPEYVGPSVRPIEHRYDDKTTKAERAQAFRDIFGLQKDVAIVTAGAYLGDEIVVAGRVDIWIGRENINLANLPKYIQQEYSRFASFVEAMADVAKSQVRIRQLA